MDNQKILISNNTGDATGSKLVRPNLAKFQQSFSKGRKGKPQSEAEMLLKNGMKTPWGF